MFPLSEQLASNIGFGRADCSALDQGKNKKQKDLAVSRHNAGQGQANEVNCLLEIVHMLLLHCGQSVESSFLGRWQEKKCALCEKRSSSVRWDRQHKDKWHQSGIRCKRCVLVVPCQLKCLEQ